MPPGTKDEEDEALALARASALGAQLASHPQWASVRGRFVIPGPGKFAGPRALLPLCQKGEGGRQGGEEDDAAGAVALTALCGAMRLSGRRKRHRAGCLALLRAVEAAGDRAVFSGTSVHRMDGIALFYSIECGTELSHLPSTMQTTNHKTQTEADLLALLLPSSSHHHHRPSRLPLAAARFLTKDAGALWGPVVDHHHHHHHQQYYVRPEAGTTLWAALHRALAASASSSPLQCLCRSGLITRGELASSSILLPAGIDDVRAGMLALRALGLAAEVADGDNVFLPLAPLHWAEEDKEAGASASATASTTLCYYELLGLPPSSPSSSSPPQLRPERLLLAALLVHLVIPPLQHASSDADPDAANDSSAVLLGFNLDDGGKGVVVGPLVPDVAALRFPAPGCVDVPFGSSDDGK